jgi:hypothetical protein
MSVHEILFTLQHSHSHSCSCCRVTSQSQSSHPSLMYSLLRYLFPFATIALAWEASRLPFSRDRILRSTTNQNVIANVSYVVCAGCAREFEQETKKRRQRESERRKGCAGVAVQTLRPICKGISTLCATTSQNLTAYVYMYMHREIQ